MDFNELSAQWQQKKLPSTLDQVMFEKITHFEEQLKKENTKLSYWLAGTIYLTGMIALPFIKSETGVFPLMGIWFLVGIQTMLFWFRQTNIHKSMAGNPARFVEVKLSKLKYNLLVTNLFMPIYMILLGIFSSFYINHILEGVDRYIVISGIGFTWLFYAMIFYITWRKQWKKDSETITPQIIELEKIQADFRQK
ncbi:MAG: hypothetical protein SF052_04045 [Bacteroidia bacterium]|nr:hypothetical protein [Bacteroidia bacterium]